MKLDKLSSIYAVVTLLGTMETVTRLEALVSRLSLAVGYLSQCVGTSLDSAWLVPHCETSTVGHSTLQTVINWTHSNVKKNRS